MTTNATAIIKGNVHEQYVSKRRYFPSP
jgi:hypothetical protein